jgi:hypothetical protein
MSKKQPPGAIRRRAEAIEAEFIQALDGEELTPLRRGKLRRAAELSAIAEACRAAAMEGGASIGELDTIEARAEKSQKEAGIF